MGQVERRIQRFEVTGTLGVGGMGVVLRAHDPQLDRPVAIKLLTNTDEEVEQSLSAAATLDLRGDSKPGRDLLQEARVMARLSHPNVLAVYEAGLVDGAVFLVMECVEGRSLTEWLALAPPREDIASALRQAAAGILAAHERGVVHGDIKPSNILVGYDARVRVADFGLARLVAQTSRVSRPTIVGTPQFMAPELWSGELPTTSSDVFAFCQTVASSLPDPPTHLAALVERGLANDAGRRPTMGELLRAFDSLPDEHVPPRRMGVRFVLAGIAVVAVVIVAYAAVTTEPESSCGDLAGHIEPARLVKLRTTLAVRSGDPAGARATEEAIMGHERAIEQSARRACAARPPDAGRLACLQRRQFELEARVTHAEANSDERDVGMFWSAETCLGARMPPTTPRTRSLYAQYVGALASKDQHAKLRDLEPELADTEPELAARVARTIGQRLGFEDRLDEADATYVRAYRLATAIGMSTLATMIAADRINIAISRSDAKTATELAKHIFDGMDHDVWPNEFYVVALSCTAAAAKQRGDTVVALAHAYAGLAFAETLAAPVPNEKQLWFTLVATMLDVPTLRTHAVETARRSVTRIAEIDGFGPNLATAHHNLATALRYADEPAFALAERYQALAVALATLPGTSARIPLIRVDLANDLVVNERFDEARAELTLVLAATTGNQRLAVKRSSALYTLADVEFERDPERAIALASEALELAIETDGVDAPWPNAVRLKVAELELDAGALDAAGRHILALAALYDASKHEGDRLQRILLRGTAEARLALLRGTPRVAERLARQAVSELAEIAPPGDLVRPRRNLAESLLAQGRHREARVEFAETLALAMRTHKPPRVQARIELGLARAEAAGGDRRAARVRALRLRDIVTEVDQRREIDRLLKAR
jgi:tetratricopeptide (TPR) repeat protein/predicted Ser/Thr protein kinase